MSDIQELLRRGRSRRSSDRASAAGELARAYAEGGRKERAALKKVRAELVALDEKRFAGKRAAIRSGKLKGGALLRLLKDVPADERDAYVEGLLGIAWPPLSGRALPPTSVPYVPSSVDAIISALLMVPVRPFDTFVDLGAGMGKVVMLARLLTGAKAVGIELQRPIVTAARERVQALGIDRVEVRCQDARKVPLDGTVYFLYAPFTGKVLEEVLGRLRAIGSLRPIVVIGLGVNLDQQKWLVTREPSNLWLTISDSVGLWPQLALP